MKVTTGGLGDVTERLIRETEVRFGYVRSEAVIDLFTRKVSYIV